MSDIQAKFAKLIAEHGDQRYQNAVLSDAGYEDDLVNHAFYCYDLLKTSPDNSAPKRAYKTWIESYSPSNKDKPQVFFDYMDQVMSEAVTEILETQWIYDRNREISHLVKCRMVILSGLSAAALFDETAK